MIKKALHPPFLPASPPYAETFRMNPKESKIIAFESTRTNNQYAIYLCDPDSGSVSGPLTEPSIQAQHAKFFPDGKKLILCALTDPENNSAARGIAWMDISSLL